MDAKEAQYIVYKRLNKVYSPLFDFLMENDITPSFDLVKKQREHHQQLITLYVNDRITDADALFNLISIKIKQKINKEKITDDDKHRILQKNQFAKRIKEIYRKYHDRKTKQRWVNISEQQSL